MGEVRTQVKLTSIEDIVKSRAGLITKDQIRSIVTDAMVDTGAVRSVIPMSILEKLGVNIYTEKTAEFANGSKEKVGVCEPIYFEIDNRDTYDEAFVLGDEVLIGQTVLEKLDLLVDCNTQTLIGNPKHPEGPVSKIK
ncbi:MAG: clan aspartic protease [Ignavibacteria bacterium]|nr:clan aspartic protease [Ignavibacteria bacterium]